MADSADLIVLGAYFGTGLKGGLLSVFLMGVYDKESKTFKTVCKAGNGFDDNQIHRLQNQLDMVRKKEHSHTLSVSHSVYISLHPCFPLFGSFARTYTSF